MRPLRDPLIRLLKQGKVVVRDKADRYEREAAFWFQMGGVFMIVQGCFIRSFAMETGGAEVPAWFLSLIHI